MPGWRGGNALDPGCPLRHRGRTELDSPSNNHLKIGRKTSSSTVPLTLPQVIKKNPSEPTQIINLNADSLRDLIRLRPKIANALARRHIHEHEAKQASKKMQ